MQTTEVFGNIPIKKKIDRILDLFYHTNRKFIKHIGNERSKKFRVPKPHDIHLWMPIKIYRWIKDSHAGQNVHEMAQIVRAILCYYIELVRKYGIKQGQTIFTDGTANHRVKRAFVHLRRMLLAFDILNRGIKHQLDKISCLKYNFIRFFVVLME